MTTGIARVAAATQRLAVLLGAGVAPASAWQHAGLPPATDAGGMIAALADAAAHAPPLESGAWRGLAAAWEVATDAGAPLAPTLRLYAQSLRSLGAAQRDVRVALAAPIATARMVLALPAIGVLFGIALGFDTVGVLLTTPLGWACLGVGSGLILAAVRWNRRMVAAAQPREAAPGIECDLMAIAVSGGGSLDRAHALVARVTARHDIAPPGERVESVLALSRSAGVPAAELLRAEAEEARLDARASAQQKAATLSVKLMLPLGLCILPAFMVLGVVPLLVSVVTSTVVQ
jgi:tight adherence protein B